MSENIIRHGSIMQDVMEEGITPPDIVDKMTIKHGTSPSDAGGGSLFSRVAALEAGGVGSGGSNMVEKVLVDEQEATFINNYGVMMATFNATPLKAGQTYNVELDGNKYTCVAGTFAQEENEYTYIGNPSIDENTGLTVDTGEPFLIVYAKGMLFVYVSMPTTYDSIDDIVLSVKITTMEEKLEGGRLSIGFFRVEGEMHCSATYAEIKDAISEAVMPVMSGDLTKLGNLPTAVLYAPDNMNPALYSVGVDFHYMGVNGMATFDSVDPQVEFMFNDNGMQRSVVMYEDNWIEYLAGEC